MGKIISKSRLKDYFKNKFLKKILETSSVNSSMSLMSKDSIWFYSQMKSGTTYTIIFLINYINEINDLNLSKKDIFNILPFLHSFESRAKSNSISKIREEQRNILNGTELGYFLHTHVNIEDFSRKRILMTRNPLDYIISCYFFHYVNRGINTSLDKVWKDILTRYISSHNSQLRISQEQPETTLFLHYEDIMKKPNHVFAELVRFLGLKLDHKSICSAILKSQKDEVKKIENAGGKAIVAGEGFIAKSFVRSGQVGEWKEYIDDSLKKKIVEFLKSEGVELSDFTFE